MGKWIHRTGTNVELLTSGLWKATAYFPGESHSARFESRKEAIEWLEEPKNQITYQPSYEEVTHNRRFSCE